MSIHNYPLNSTEKDFERESQMKQKGWTSNYKGLPNLPGHKYNRTRRLVKDLKHCPERQNCTPYKNTTRRQDPTYIVPHRYRIPHRSEWAQCAALKNRSPFETPPTPFTTIQLPQVRNDSKVASSVDEEKIEPKKYMKFDINGQILQWPAEIKKKLIWCREKTHSTPLQHSETTLNNPPRLQPCTTENFTILPLKGQVGS